MRDHRSNRRKSEWQSNGGVNEGVSEGTSLKAGKAKTGLSRRSPELVGVAKADLRQELIILYPWRAEGKRVQALMSNVKT